MDGTKLARLVVGEAAVLIDDAPPDYIDAMLNAIVGFELQITYLEGKRKQSQNRNDADRAGVAAARLNLAADKY